MSVRTISVALQFGLLVLPSWASGAPCDALFEKYRQTSKEARKEVLKQITADGSLGLVCLMKVLDRTRTSNSLEDYESLLSAIASLNTDAAASFLYDEAASGTRWHSYIPASHLAAMGKRALPHLLRLSEKRELGMSRSPDDLPVHPHYRRPLHAVTAARAIALISDRAAVPDLLLLVSSETWLAIPALNALARMRAVGAEAEAVALWEKKNGEAEISAAALRYLLAVDRTRYLPLLQKSLDAFESSLSRIASDGKTSRKARHSVPFEMESLIRKVFYLGSDPIAVDPLTRFIESRLWASHASHQSSAESAALAILALGLSHSPTARKPLVKVLNDKTEFAPLLRNADLDYLTREHPHWPQMLAYGTSAKTKASASVPASVVAAVALGELGDRSVIPEIEEATKRDPYLKDVYEEIIMKLRGKGA